MLSKCANPSCSAPFRYLHEGKMFQLDMEVMRGPEVRHQGRKLVSKQKWSRKIEHYWLCNACASSQPSISVPASRCSPRTPFACKRTWRLCTTSSSKLNNDGCEGLLTPNCLTLCRLLPAYFSRRPAGSQQRFGFASARLEFLPQLPHLHAQGAHQVNHGAGARHQQRRSYFELHMALRMINQASRRLKSAYPESRLLPGRKNQNSSESLSFAKS